MDTRAKAKNFFRRHKLLSRICSLFSCLGVYLALEWSGNRSLPSAESLGLEYTNRLENYTYRLKIVYVNKKERKRIEGCNVFFYSNDLKFILAPR